MGAWPLPVQASTDRFWDLWALFDMPGLSLQHIHVRAALQQVGKVGADAADAVLGPESCLHCWLAAS